MKICILGAGALGCALGAALSEAGADVRLLNRSPAQVAAMNADGLAIVTPDGERRVAVRAATRALDIGPVDLVVVLVKSFHTREAMAGARALLGPHTLLLSLQNGLGHEDILAEFVGVQRVLAGKTYVGGVMLAPGRIVSDVAGKLTLIGELDGRITPRAWHGARAAASSPRYASAAEPAVPILRLRHHHPPGRPRPGPAQCRGGRQLGLQRHRDRRAAG